MINQSLYIGVYSVSLEISNLDSIPLSLTWPSLPVPLTEELEELLRETGLLTPALAPSQAFTQKPPGGIIFQFIMFIKRFLIYTESCHTTITKPEKSSITIRPKALYATAL